MSIVLGIESTCDETGASVVVEGKKILSNVLFSQIESHKLYGGVFPEIASRRHLEVMLPIIDQSIKEANISKEQIDLIAVSTRPGLLGALLMGLNTAKALAYAWKKPFIGINHVEAHLYAAIMNDPSPHFPAVGLVISGGHTSLMEIEQVHQYTTIGTTHDDAVGEAFDKVARILSLPYPGGPEIEKLALNGQKGPFSFRKGVIKNNPFAFSFSGLKTQVLYATLERTLSPQERCDIAFAFQETALTDLVQKTLLLSRQKGLSKIYIGGGVSNNKRLKNLFLEQKDPDQDIFFPSPGLSLDNAAMIAGLAYPLFHLKNCLSDPMDLISFPTNRHFS